MEVVKNWTYKILETPTWVSILAGTALVVWQFLMGSLPPSVQIAFFTFFIFLTGIPHGAIDHLVEKETAERVQKPFNLPVFLAKYLATMLFYGLAWYVMPSFSLLFFVLISAWHFGETDIEQAPATVLWHGTRFSFGCFVLLWILLFHAAETTPILARISQNSAVVMSVWQFSVDFTRLILLVSASIFTLFFILAHKNKAVNFDKIRFLRLGIILILIYFLPLLPAFALYFGGWHALNSFKAIHDYLMENRSDLAHKSLAYSVLKVWSKTLFFTFLAFSFMAFAAWYWFQYMQTWDPLPLLFVFLSLITLPHLNVMRKMNSIN
jgi:beta-carotene 15,15'-dioxygenase